MSIQRILVTGCVVASVLFTITALDLAFRKDN